jgi:hypothetical protein
LPSPHFDAEYPGTHNPSKRCSNNPAQLSTSIKDKHVRSVIFSGLAFLLFGCDRTDSRGNEAVMPTSSVPQGEMCPDITGTFEFEPKSTAARFLVGKRWANQGFSLLRIESTSNKNNYRFTVKAPVEAFNAAAARLAEQNPKRHAEWEASERTRACDRAGESRVVLDEDCRDWTSAGACKRGGDANARVLARGRRRSRCTQLP